MEKTKSGANLLALETISSLVEHRIGNYLLGYIDEKGNFVTKYVGRSDTDLNRRLKEHLDEYTHFKYSYANSVFEAFMTEMRDFYRFGGSTHLDNKICPAFPKGFDIAGTIKRIEKVHLELTQRRRVK